MYALTRLPARTIGILVSVEPAMGALLGLMFLNEHLSAFQWLAIAAIIAASIGAVLGARQAPVKVRWDGVSRPLSPLKSGLQSRENCRGTRQLRAVARKDSLASPNALSTQMSFSIDGEIGQPALQRCVTCAVAGILLQQCLEARISTQRIPDRIKLEQCRRNGDARGRHVASARSFFPSAGL
jgi:hypothetical protein